MAPSWRIRSSPPPAHRIRRSALGGQPGDGLVEVAGVAHPVAGPGHLDHRRAMRRAVHSWRVGLQEHRHGPQVECPPTPPALASVEPRRPPAASAAPPSGALARPHRHHHGLGLLIEDHRLDDRERHPEVADEASITRAVLEDYLSWLLSQGYSASTRALSLSMLRVFSDACHRHGWLPGLAAGAVIYVEELPFHHDQVARFIPELVMAQLESDAALAQIPLTTTRHLVVVLIETGLRGGDACALAFNPVLDDSVGWPCLRFEATKVRAEQLIPLSAKAAAAIHAQQAHVLQQWPAGSPWLFPGIVDNTDGSKAYSHSSLRGQLARWQQAIDLRDQAGQPTRVTPHQFRHTLG